MPPKKEKATEEWVGFPRALAILEEVNKRKISSTYVARLGQSGRVRRRQVDGRTYEYNVEDLNKAILISRPSAVPRPGRPLKKKPSENHTHEME